MAGAGPLSNLIIALIFGTLLRLGVSDNPAFIGITSVVVFINILLAIFNLVPIPPLDGSKILFAFFPEHTLELRHFFERYGLILILFFIFFLWQFVAPLVTFLFRLITGLAL